MSVQPRTQDLMWVNGLFGLAPRARDSQSRSQRRYSNLHFNFADTTIGGSQAINCPPQFTATCDPPFTGLFANPEGRTEGSRSDYSDLFSKENNQGSYRMGSFFFESIYDNAHFVHCRFGKPKYTGMINFFANNYDSNLAHLAKTGDYNSFARNLGAWAGAAAIYSVVGPLAFVTLLAVPQVLKFALGRKPSKYYYLKPTMHTYLRAVQSILDTQALHYRLLPMAEIFGRDKYEYEMTEEERNQVYDMLPDIWKSNGKFDVYKAINRYQVLANYQARQLNAIYDAATDADDLQNRLRAHMRQAKTTALYKNYATENETTLQKLEDLYKANPAYQSENVVPPGTEEYAKQMVQNYDKQHFDAARLQEEQRVLQLNTTMQENAAEFKVASFWEGIVDDVSGSFSDIAEQSYSELKDGGQWISFMISNKESISDSFTSSTREPEISSKLKGIASSARSLEVSTSGGNTGFEFADSAMKGVKSFLSGAVDSLHLTGLLSLYGGAIIDFPEVWDDSNAQIGQTTLNFPLQSWSGSDFDLYQNIIFPLSFWLAAAIPNSTGSQSYTHPFYVEAYSPGKFMIRNGIITNLSITRGEGNVPFKADGKMLGCTLSVTIKDLSTVMHMPLISDPGIFDDDSMFTDYMSILGSASLFEMTNGFQKLNMNLNKWRQSWKSHFMTGNVTSSVMNSVPARVLASAIAGGNYR